MSLMEEVEKFMCSADVSVNYRVINLGGKSVYIEGIKSVVNLGSNEMQFQLKKNLIVVAGVNLKLKYLDKSTCVVDGDIFGVNVK